MVFAKNPLLTRFQEFPDNKPVTIITGSDSWVNFISDFGAIRELLSSKNLDLLFIEDAGHHVHADQPVQFNMIVNKICDSVNNSYIDTKTSFQGLVTAI